MTCKVCYRRKDDGSRFGYWHIFEGPTKDEIENKITAQLQLLQKIHPTMIVSEKRYKV